MKKVVIGVKNGNPYVISCPRKVEVVFKEERKPSLKKQWRIMLYKVKILPTTLFSKFKRA